MDCWDSIIRDFQTAAQRARQDEDVNGMVRCIEGLHKTNIMFSAAIVNFLSDHNREKNHMAEELDIACENYHSLLKKFAKNK
ncbi:hypothetical protein M5689_020718 [Euphorbia peplus]|nr:hypothetical protein M5689_020718 [Euphorbia peplus]